MQHFHSLDEVQLADVWLTIGSFDGVHRGHQAILHKVLSGARANHAQAAVVTFYPHPAAILRGRNLPYYLTSPQEKATILEQLGIDVVITHPFNREVANKSAREFIQHLKAHLDFHHLQVGYDFALGKDRGGDFSTLQNLGKEFEFTIQQSQPVSSEGDVISSSRIRFLLGVGQVQQAAQLLGRLYQVDAMVEVGDKRGRSLGFPTANLAIWKEKLIPTAGVYACWATVRGEIYQAVTNIGVRPTFETSPVAPRVEAHLLDFDLDIYGESLQLAFADRLRDEQRFPSVDHLVAQLHQDVQDARNVLKNTIP
jgi:riboflavin kinase/FMN adenylyltransferase